MSWTLWEALGIERARRHHAALCWASGMLSSREYLVLWYRYRHRMTLKQVGAQIHPLTGRPRRGVGRERARQIEAKVLRKLRRHMAHFTG